MRDQDYAASPTAGTYRAVLLGASSVMGWGVSDGQTFEALVEKRLNEQATGGQGFERFELMNLGIPGYDPPQQMVMVERALGFEPNAVFFVSTAKLTHGPIAQRPNVSLSSHASLKFSSCAVVKAPFGLV